MGPSQAREKVGDITVAVSFCWWKHRLLNQMGWLKIPGISMDFLVSVVFDDSASEGCFFHNME